MASESETLAPSPCNKIFKENLIVYTHFMLSMLNYQYMRTDSL